MRLIGTVGGIAIVSLLLVCTSLDSLSSLTTDVLGVAPTRQTLRITAPAGTDEAKVLAALNEEIASQHARIRLSFVETASMSESAQALREGRADAAVVRADDPTAGARQTIFILKRLHAVLLTPAQASIENIGKLKGKQIAVLAGETGIDPMARAVLDFYGFDEKHVAPLRSDELPRALTRKQVAAVLVVGPSGKGLIADTVEAFRKSTGRAPKFLDISEAKAIAERFPVYADDEISSGAFGGAPVVPAENAGTISTTLLLVSRASLSNYTAAELTRLLLATKSKMATTWSGASQLTAPPTDKDALRPAHPGTIAFLNGDQSDVLDKSTNLILLGSMLTGSVGSLGAWLNRFRRRRKGGELKRRMRTLPLLLAEANAASPDQLDALEHELEGLSQWLTPEFVANGISSKDFENSQARLAHLGALMQRKRRGASLDQLEHFFEQWRSCPATVAAR